MASIQRKLITIPRPRVYEPCASAAMASTLQSAFLAPPCAIPTKPLATSTPSSSSQSVATPCRRIVASSQSEEGSPAATCSRREALGMGGMLTALTAFNLNAAAAAEPAATTCAPGSFNVAPSGLAYCDSRVGTGIVASKGMLIKAHYAGKLTNGVQFDSSYKRGKPLTFRVGVGEVIRGWDQGILGSEGIPPMQAGGKRVLKIPANLGYGERGAGCRAGSCLIPPNSVLIFDVEFVGKA